MTCALWSDPCKQWSLDDCATCVTAGVSAACVYIPAEKCCVADHSITWRGGPFIRRVEECSRSENNGVSKGHSILYIVYILSIFVFLILLIVILVIFWWWIISHRDPLVQNASTEFPGVEFCEREREILWMKQLPVQGPKGRPVQGIPLKRISFHELIAKQKKRNMI